MTPGNPLIASSKIPYQLTTGIAALLVLIALAKPAQAQTTSAWTGTSNSTWGTAGNWAGGVPSSTVSALFNGTFSNQPTLLASGTSQGIWLATGVGQDVTIDSAVARTLTIAGNATLNSQTNAAIYMNDSGNHNLTFGPNVTISQINTAGTGIYNQQSSGTLTISGTVNTGNRLLTIGAGATSTGNVTISGSIIPNSSAGGAVTINSAGTVTLTGINTYTGATTINAGTLSIASITNGGVAGALGNSTNAAANLVLGGGALQYTGSSNGSTDRNFTITAGTTGTISVTNSATTLTISGNGAATTGALIKAGAGTLSLNGANAYTGTTTINAGTLQIGNGSTTGSLSTSSAITNNATLAFNRTNTITQGTDFASVISGTGALIQAGSGNLILTGANTFTGATNINAGTLQIGNGGTTGSLSTSSAITNNATLAFNRSNTITQGTDFASVISGTGALIQAGSGNLILTGANTFTGTTTINSGTLQIGNGGTTGSLTTSSAITNNGTLAFNRTDTVAQGTDFAL